MRERSVREREREHILGGGETGVLAHRTWSYVRFRSAASVLPDPPSD